MFDVGDTVKTISLDGSVPREGRVKSTDNLGNYEVCFDAAQLDCTSFAESALVLVTDEAEQSSPDSEPVEIEPTGPMPVAELPAPLAPAEAHSATALVHYTLDTHPAGECRMAAVVGTHADDVLDLLVLTAPTPLVVNGVRKDSAGELLGNHWHALDAAISAPVSPQGAGVAPLVRGDIVRTTSAYMGILFQGTVKEVAADGQVTVCSDAAQSNCRTFLAGDLELVPNAQAAAPGV